MFSSRTIKLIGGPFDGHSAPGCPKATGYVDLDEMCDGKPTGYSYRYRKHSWKKFVYSGRLTKQEIEKKEAKCLADDPDFSKKRESAPRMKVPDGAHKFKFEKPNAQA